MFHCVPPCDSRNLEVGNLIRACEAASRKSRSAEDHPSPLTTSAASRNRQTLVHSDAPPRGSTAVAENLLLSAYLRRLTLAPGTPGYDYDMMGATSPDQRNTLQTW